MLAYFKWQLTQAYDQDGIHSKSADLLIGIGETVGCGERHTDFQTLIDALDSHKVSSGNYDWYIRMKKEYPLQTAGFGLGIERFFLWILKHDDIRDMAILSRLKDVDSFP